MSYSQFTLQEAKKAFALSIEENQSLFKDIHEETVSDYLQTTLSNFAPLALAINTEKSRSEWIIAPILAETRHLLNNHISLFSGTEFNVDPSKGLNGTCDFIISLSSEQYFMSAPVVTIVEAKRENINEGLGQCVATMIGAYIYNTKEGNNIKRIYGVVTTGTNWKFLLLEDEKKVFIDIDDYYLANIGKIIGILVSMTAQTIEH